MSEGELLEMSNHYKETLNDKEETIKRLAKTISLIYGLIRCCEEEPETSTMLLGVIRDYLNIELDKLFGFFED
jgi:hypothetical protein